MKRSLPFFIEDMSIRNSVSNPGGVVSDLLLMQTLHFRTDLHLMRKLWHFLTGLLIVGIYFYWAPRLTGVVILSFVLGCDLMFEWLRLRYPSFNRKMLKLWGPIMRTHELHQLSTVPHYVSAALLAVMFFPKHVAILSILYLACGDPMASLIGILYGDKGIRFKNGKSVIGTLAGVLTCILVTFFYLKAISMEGEKILILSLVGGSVGGLVELVPFDMDDNFTIPVISGFALWLAFMICGF